GPATGRRRRRGAARDRARPLLAAAGDHRERRARRRRRGGRRPHRPQGAGRAAGARRLRDRLLLARLPPAPAGGHGQDRPLVPQRGGRRPAHAGDRAGDRVAGPRAGDGRHGGGDRDRRAARLGARGALRARPGLLLLAAPPRRGDGPPAGRRSGAAPSPRRRDTGLGPTPRSRPWGVGRGAWAVGRGPWAVSGGNERRVTNDWLVAGGPRTPHGPRPTAHAPRPTAHGPGATRACGARLLDFFRRTANAGPGDRGDGMRRLGEMTAPLTARSDLAGAAA